MGILRKRDESNNGIRNDIMNNKSGPKYGWLQRKIFKVGFSSIIKIIIWLNIYIPIQLLSMKRINLFDELK